MWRRGRRMTRRSGRGGGPGEEEGRKRETWTRRIWRMRRVRMQVKRSKWVGEDGEGGKEIREEKQEDDKEENED